MTHRVTTTQNWASSDQKNRFNKCCSCRHEEFKIYDLVFSIKEQQEAHQLVRPSKTPCCSTWEVLRGRLTLHVDNSKSKSPSTLHQPSVILWSVTAVVVAFWLRKRRNWISICSQPEVASDVISGASVDSAANVLILAGFIPLPKYSTQSRRTWNFLHFHGDYFRPEMDIGAISHAALIEVGVDISIKCIDYRSSRSWVMRRAQFATDNQTS